jgi:hypothetical protein
MIAKKNHIYAVSEQDLNDHEEVDIIFHDGTASAYINKKQNT